jgi:hypothetical protein
MRKIITLLFVLWITAMNAQAPQKMSHRGTAYNSSGAILANTTVAIRVRILNGSSSGTIIYEERHGNKLTNAQGQYSLEIGGGTIILGTLAAVDWGSGSKYLEIAIDPANGTSYGIPGSNQLMSVPYAFYAQKVDSQASGAPVVSVNSLNDLRNSDFHTKNIITVYVKYHTSVGDGGGGFFNWNGNTPNVVPGSSPPDTVTYADDDGVIINPTSNSGQNGRWLRKMEGYVDVRYYGCLGHSQSSDGTKIQKAIDFAARNVGNNFYTKGNVVFLHNGSYSCTKLVLKKGVTLKGESKENTSIGTPANDPNPYLVEMAPGIVEGIAIEDLNFISLDTDPSHIKGCFNFKATLGTDGAGGLWNSRLKNLKIMRFTGTALNFEGGADFKLPNQFITLENVEAEGIANIRTETNPFIIPPVLRLAGLNGQFVFTNCRFDGGTYLFNTGNSEPAYQVSGINVYIGSVSADYHGSDIFFSPSVITFNTSTIQTGEIGFYIQSGTNIHINNCWFENFERAIVVKGDSCEGGILPEGCVKSKGIDIIGNLFLYSAGRYGHLPDNTGKVIAVENAMVTIANNYVIDPTTTEQTYFVSTDGADVLGINLSNNYFDTPKLGKTYGVLQERSVGSITINSATVNGLKTQYNKIIFVKNATESTVENVYRIESNIGANEEISIRAEKGSLIFNAFNSVTGTPGYNLYLGEKPTLTLNQGQIARFIKLDNIIGGEYGTLQLISVSNDEDSKWNYISTFSNSTSSFDTNTTVRYRKKGGVVHLDGCIKGGTTQSNGTAYSLFTLPTGFRPSRKISVVIVRANSALTNTTAGRIDIDTNGNVYGVNYSNLWNSLSAISFPTD